MKLFLKKKYSKNNQLKEGGGSGLGSGSDGDGVSRSRTASSPEPGTGALTSLDVKR